MSETSDTPDFDQIARPVIEKLSDTMDPDNARAFVLDTIERWILATVDDRVVPSDEGNGDALKYNLIHLLRDGPAYRRYEYADDQDAEIAAWGLPTRYTGL
jgi:hypothetical protein